MATRRRLLAIARAIVLLPRAAARVLAVDLELGKILRSARLHAHA